MDDDPDGSLDAGAYDELVADLAAEARSELPDRSRSDAVWDAVGQVVPRLTDTVCERVLELADNEPNEALVTQVTTERDSAEDETLRAEALTALVADVEERVVAAEAEASDGVGRQRNDVAEDA